jgi:uncharacterized membrane protein YidH (DUF202 family)
LPVTQLIGSIGVWTAGLAINRVPPILLDVDSSVGYWVSTTTMYVGLALMLAGLIVSGLSIRNYGELPREHILRTPVSEVLKLSDTRQS